MKRGRNTGARWIKPDGAMHWVMTCVISEPGQWNAAEFRADLPDRRGLDRACTKAIRDGFAVLGGHADQYLIATEAGRIALAKCDDPDEQRERKRRARVRHRQKRQANGRFV